MKFINPTVTIMDMRMNGLDYQKRNLTYEDFWRRERDNYHTLNKSIY